MPRRTRVGLGVIFAGIALFGSSVLWLATRDWVPLDLPVSLSQGHIRVKAIKVNVAGTYTIEILVNRIEGAPCLIGLHQCESISPVVSLLWSLSDGSRRVASGRSEHDGAFGGTETIGVSLGFFEAG